MRSLPNRKRLYHSVPPWVKDGSVFFITINCKVRDEYALCHSNTADLLLSAIRYYNDNSKWRCRLLVLMPDHLHALISFPTDSKITNTVRSWKRYTARITGIGWQDGFFDHRIRNNESEEEKALYIRANPVRKGLCATPGDWSYVWGEEDLT